jgi:predicted restriction endonuclease
VSCHEKDGALGSNTLRAKFSECQAPHKPFVVLSVLDLVAEGEIDRNIFEPSFELLDTFNGYWTAIMPLGTKGNMAYPFPRLRTDGLGLINFQLMFRARQRRGIRT